MKNNNKTNYLSAVKSEEAKKQIVERCKDKNPIADGLQCPHCGIFETFKNSKNPEDTTKWSFIIKAFRVDNFSKCKNCGNWF